ncbi:PH-like domain-containing protein [Saccharopolyspora endophytica]|uniref:Transporter n=1 Tax=Saccharopolyspora endophytica TaxID=543886 RepID=A0ABS5DJV2_9PSEU|nr:transporter [Saccharopolyspora endophytica]MBQ0926575.1 transporter [Saccharopolyspora endophytica]
MERLLWVLALAALAALVFFGMRRGWLARARRQAAELPPFPERPADPGAETLTPATGMYIGTTSADDWQDRIAVGDIGHRANGTAHLHTSGLLIERDGASAVWVPAESVVDARLDHKLANKVVPGAGLVVVTWRLGDQLLDTGFRGDDKQAQTEWVEAIRSLPARTTSNESEDG